MVNINMTLHQGRDNVLKYFSVIRFNPNSDKTIQTIGKNVIILKFNSFVTNWYHS